MSLEALGWVHSLPQGWAPGWHPPPLHAQISQAPLNQQQSLDKTSSSTEPGPLQRANPRMGWPSFSWHQGDKGLETAQRGSWWSPAGRRLPRVCKDRPTPPRSALVNPRRCRCASQLCNRF